MRHVPSVCEELSALLLLRLLGSDGQALLEDRSLCFYGPGSGQTPAWREGRWRLVALSKSSEDKIVVSRVGYHEREQPRASAGFRAEDQGQTLDWFRDPRGLVFLFPVDQMRPDLVCFLEHEENGGLVLAFVQVKSGSKWSVKEAISSVSWDGIWRVEKEGGKVRKTCFIVEVV